MLDLTDPKLALKIPGVRWLALYNAFQYDSSKIQYRIVSDSEVQIVYQERMHYTPDFPYEHFPEHLPLLRAPIRNAMPISIDSADQLRNSNFQAVRNVVETEGAVSLLFVSVRSSSK